MVQYFKTKFKTRYSGQLDMQRNFYNRLYQNKKHRYNRKLFMKYSYVMFELKVRKSKAQNKLYAHRHSKTKRF